MQVRNLNEFIESFIGKEWDSNNRYDLWVEKLFGGGKDMQQHISHITKFATGTGTQIFYEFLQNADDAKAESVYFFVSEGNLLVLNTGNPFFTDKSSTNLRADLYAFLNKGNKFNNPDTHGKYGQGAKLLYNLLLPIDSPIETGLWEVIGEQQKGPIIFSWQNPYDFEKLRYLTDIKQLNFTGDCNDGNIPLLTKIVNTCYPASLGEILNGKALFTDQELRNCCSFIQQTNLPPQITSGSLLYIPLGEDQHIELLRLLEGELEKGMSGTLCHIKNLKRIEINDKIINKTDYEVIKFDDFTLGLPKTKTDTSIIYNFYSNYPITDTKFGLDFIINSTAYEVDSGRQRINDNESNKRVLADISKQIIEYIKRISSTPSENIPHLVIILKCVLKSNPFGNDKLGIKKLFHDDLLEVIKNKLPTSNSDIQSSTKVRIKDTQLQVDLASIGVKEWYFFSEDLADCYKEAEDKLGLKTLSIIEILQQADKTLLTQWINNLNDTEYRILLSEIKTKSTPHQIQDLRFVKATDSEVYTPNELSAASDKILLYADTKELQHVLIRLGIICSNKIVSEYKLYSGTFDYEKLVKVVNIKPFSLASDKWEILKVLIQNKDKSLIREKLIIFEDINKKKQPLSNLYYSESNTYSSGILDGFKLSADEYTPNLDEYLMQDDEIWGHLTQTKIIWDTHVLPKLKKIKYDTVLDDLEKIYGYQKSQDKLSNDYTYIWASDGEYYAASKIYHNDLILEKKLSENEYNELCDIITQNSDLKTIPFDYLQIISQASFGDISNISNSDLLKHWTTKDEIFISKTQLDILLKINKNSFLNSYIIQIHEEGYSLKAKGNYEKQYTLEDDYVNTFLTTQNPQKYFLLPKALTNNFDSDTSLAKADKNFIIDLINNYNSQPSFIELVAASDDEVKKLYLSQIQTFEILAQNDSPYIKKIIELYTNSTWIEEFREKVLINGFKVSGCIYNEKVSIKYQEDKKPAEFQLSELLTSMSDITIKAKAVEKAKDFLKDKGIRYGNLFENKPFPKDKIQSELLSKELENTEQLCFLWAYQKSKEEEGLMIESLNMKKLDTQRINLLDSVYKHDFTFFSEFLLPKNCFNPKYYMSYEVDSQLILESEELPDDIMGWWQVESPKESQKRKEFLENAGMLKKDSHVVQIRQNLVNDKYLILKPILDIYEDFFYSNTLKWAYENKKYSLGPINRNSDQYEILQKLIYEKIKYSKDSPNFVLYLNADLSCKLDTFGKSTYYVEKIDNEEQEMWRDALKHLKGNLLIDATYYMFTSDIKKYLGTKVEIVHNFDETDAQRAEHWNNDYYLDWRKHEGFQLEIHKTSQEIPFKYILKLSEEIKFEKIYYKGNAKRTGSKLYVFFDNSDPFEFLMDNQEELFPNDAHLLMSLIKRAWKSSNTENHTESGAGNGNINVPDEKLELIDQLKDWDKEILEDILNGHYEKKGEDEDSTASELIGRIGEELAMKWLEDRGLNPEHVAVTKGTKEYDILISKDKTGKERYIDAKTTTKSVIENDASVPIHIHRHAMQLLDKDPNLNYFIIRISLNDLGIADWNEELKTEFGYKGDERKLSDELIDAIKENVENFWIDEKNREKFNKTVKEFRLSMPKKQEQ